MTTPARHAKERRIETNYSDDARCLFINGAQIRNTYEVTLRNMRQQIDRTIDIARLYILYVLGIHRSAVLLSIFICGRILFTN